MFEALKKLAKFDPISVTESIAAHLPDSLPKELVKKRLLDVLVVIGIPFNRWLGFRIQEFSPERVTIESPPTVLRRNHVGTAHACAQALLGEFPAGLLVAQRYPLESYRMIISKLEIEYHKAGTGTLFGRAEAPADWPEVEDDEAWIDMRTRITNEAGVLVADCRTRWQVKSWARINVDRAIRDTEQSGMSQAGDRSAAGDGGAGGYGGDESEDGLIDSDDTGER